MSEKILNIQQQDLQSNTLKDLANIFDRGEDFSKTEDGQTITYDFASGILQVSYDKFPGLTREIQYVFNVNDYTDFFLIKTSPNAQLCVGRHHQSGHAGPVQIYIESSDTSYHYNEEKNAFLTSDDQRTYPEDTSFALKCAEVLKGLV